MPGILVSASLVICHVARRRVGDKMVQVRALVYRSVYDIFSSGQVYIYPGSAGLT